MRLVTRRRFLGTTAIAGLGTAGGHAAGHGGERVLIEPATVWCPKFRGWGTSLAWWARMAGGFPDEIRSETPLPGLRDHRNKTPIAELAFPSHFR